MANQLKLFGQDIDINDINKSDQTVGIQVGSLAESDKHNRLFRQWSVIANAIGEIMDARGVSTSDDDLEILRDRVVYALTGMTLDQIKEVGNKQSSAVFKGASEYDNGTTGVVPQPLAGQQNYVLMANGRWVKTSVADYSQSTYDAPGIEGLVPAPPAGTPLRVVTSNYGWYDIDQELKDNIINASIDYDNSSIVLTKRGLCVKDGELNLVGGELKYDNVNKTLKFPIFNGKTSGLVKKPKDVAGLKYLKSDGEFDSIPLASDISDGLLSMSDYSYLTTTVGEISNKYLTKVNPTGSGNLFLSDGQIYVGNSVLKGSTNTGKWAIRFTGSNSDSETAEVANIIVSQESQVVSASLSAYGINNQKSVISARVDKDGNAIALAPSTIDKEFPESGNQIVVKDYFDNTLTKYKESMNTLINESIDKSRIKLVRY